MVSTYRKDYGDGCNLHDHCLTCPLIACKFDDPGIERRENSERLADKIREQLDLGTTYDRITVLLHCSKQTVQRVAKLHNSRTEATARQKTAIAAMLAKGYSPQVIAAEMAISLPVVYAARAG